MEIQLKCSEFKLRFIILGLNLRIKLSFKLVQVKVQDLEFDYINSVLSTDSPSDVWEIKQRCDFLILN